MPLDVAIVAIRPSTPITIGTRPTHLPGIGCRFTHPVCRFRPGEDPNPRPVLLDVPRRACAFRRVSERWQRAPGRMRA